MKNINSHQKHDRRLAFNLLPAQSIDTSGNSCESFGTNSLDIACTTVLLDAAVKI